MSNKIALDILEILIKQEYIWEPACDVSVINNKIIVELDIPNLDINSLSINIINGLKLEILGERKRLNREEGVYLLAERVFGKFKKTIDLPTASKRVQDINYEDGILKIVIQGVEHE
ncbi:Hsp20/alpha crystallin family protein [Hippea alviniae]|uniref:Hsp20/alpha crystallin family protein n=1 Tax=Hippea alviniae TaxID=1279027 RepID=UPI0003B6394B|nr:Hsp20/alpha crystallin family protein [Hippea alviniae]